LAAQAERRKPRRMTRVDRVAARPGNDRDAGRCELSLQQRNVRFADLLNKKRGIWRLFQQLPLITFSILST
jgi:hypothetical protein